MILTRRQESILVALHIAGALSTETLRRLLCDGSKAKTERTIESLRKRKLVTTHSRTAWRITDAGKAEV